MNSVASIREKEKQSHTELYSSTNLYQDGSWLQRPIKTVLNLIPLFENYKSLNVLDLGCGVGRNCIAIAERYKSIPCSIDCVDLLDIAIEKLTENAAHYRVSNAINGIVSTIEAYPIKPGKYDLILAVSALEHTESKEKFLEKLKEIKHGIRPNGIVCLVVNSEVSERSKETGAPLFPQFEVNLETEEMKSILVTVFSGWQVIKQTTSTQQYDIPRGESTSDLRTTVVTFVARKPTA